MERTKAGCAQIIEYWRRLKKEYGEDYAMMQGALREWYRSLPRNHPSKKLSRYKWIDKFGPWRDRDISWPGGGGPRYPVPHPVTHQPCKIPEAGWRFATSEEMQRQIRIGLVEFRDDHTEPPFREARHPSCLRQKKRRKAHRIKRTIRLRVRTMMQQDCWSCPASFTNRHRFQ